MSINCESKLPFPHCACKSFDHITYYFWPMSLSTKQSFLLYRIESIRRCSNGVNKEKGVFRKRQDKTTGILVGIILVFVLCHVFRLAIQVSYFFHFFISFLFSFFFLLCKEEIFCITDLRNCISYSRITRPLHWVFQAETPSCPGCGFNSRYFHVLSKWFYKNFNDFRKNYVFVW